MVLQEQQMKVSSETKVDVQLNEFPGNFESSDTEDTTTRQNAQNFAADAAAIQERQLDA